MAYPASAKMFPDLQYYFRNYMMTNKLDRYEVPIPGDIYSEHLTECRSFIRLLFDETWQFANYSHCYTKIEDFGAWPISIRDRLLIYTHSEYYLPHCNNIEELYQICDSTSTEYLNSIDHNSVVCSPSLNIFDLDKEDFLLLDALNIYRCDSTAVIVYEQEDVSSNTLTEIPGEGKWLLSISFNSLNSTLAKLIFIYLNLKVNLEHDFYVWDGTNYLSTNLFEHLYELFVIDKVFHHMTDSGPDYIED